MLVRHIAGKIRSIRLLRTRLLLLLLLLLLLFVITFTQGIYSYIPEKNMLLGYKTLQLLYSYNLWYMYCYFPCSFVLLHCYFTKYMHSAHMNVSCSALMSCFPSAVHDIFWMILKLFQLPLLLLVSLLHPTLTCLLFLSPSFALIFNLFLHFISVLT